jgi:hypothetical protein
LKAAVLTRICRCAGCAADPNCGYCFASNSEWVGPGLCGDCYIGAPSLVVPQSLGNLYQLEKFSLNLKSRFKFHLK